MTVFNDLIEEYTIASNSAINMDFGNELQTTESGINYSLQKMIIPIVKFKLSLSNLTEVASKAIVTFLVDNKGKTFEFDMSIYRADYNGTNTLILSAMSGIVQVIQQNGREFEVKVQSGATHFNTVTVDLETSKNIIT
jgi:hypothetical protein